MFEAPGIEASARTLLARSYIDGMEWAEARDVRPV